MKTVLIFACLGVIALYAISLMVALRLWFGAAERRERREIGRTIRAVRPR